MYHGIESGSSEEHFEVREVANERRYVVGPLTVTAYRVNHPVVAFGYRVEDGTGAVAMTGDTDACDNLDPLLTGVTWF